MSNNATIALATGGSRGLGHSTVEALARRGVNICNSVRRKRSFLTLISPPDTVLARYHVPALFCSLSIVKTALH